MDPLRLLLLAYTALIFFPPHLLAQDTPILLEAESATRGSAFNFAEQNGVQYISIASTIAGGNPTSDARIAAFTVTFPAAGSYELYAMRARTLV